MLFVVVVLGGVVGLGMLGFFSDIVYSGKLIKCIVSGSFKQISQFAC